MPKPNSLFAVALSLALLLGLSGCITVPKNGRPAPEPSKDSAVALPDAPATPDAVWDDLAAGNRRFIVGYQSSRELLRSRETLSQGQSPKVMVLACADSRLSPEIIFDKTLGDLFVCRVAGNVPDPAIVGSLEFGRQQLGCQVLVVLGHDSCGAVAAAASGNEMPSDGLKDLVARIRPALAEVPAGPDAATHLNLLVRANVQHAADDILATSPILKKESDEGRLLVVRAVYHLRSGEVERLSQR